MSTLKLSLGLILLFVCLLGVKGNTDIHFNATGQNPPKFKLQLDLAPEQRWVEIAQAYKGPLYAAFGFLDKYFDSIPFSNAFFSLFGWWAENIFQFQEMVAEVKGISKAVDLPFGKLMFMNFVYEFSVGCSGIVIRNNESQILHGRNMDFGMYEYFSKLLAVVDIYLGNTYICTIDSIVGSVFALTGIKPGKFAINEDTRTAKSDQIDFITVFYNLLFKSYTPSAWLIREVLISQNSFAAARKILIETTVDAPIYYILSGIKPNEGTVIEKSTVGVHAVYDLNETTWFLVQTNYDRDQPDPSKDQRRTPVEQKLIKHGNQINIQYVFDDIMSQWPTLNAHTILTMTAVPVTGYHNATAWYGIVNGTDTQQNSKIIDK